MPIARRHLLTGLPVLAGGSLAAAPALAGPSATPQGVMFDADYEHQGFRRYLIANPIGVEEGIDYGIGTDPLGRYTKVAWFDSRRRRTVGTPWPRSGVLTAPMLETETEYWFRMDVMVPSQSALSQGNDWIAIGTPFYGPPYGGSGPMSLSVVRSRVTAEKVYLQVGADYDRLRESVSFPLGRWVGLAVRFQLSRSSARGFGELLINTRDGLPRSGWRLVTFHGERAWRGATFEASRNGGGMNDSRVGVYGNKPGRVLVATHRVGTSKYAVADVGEY